MSPERGALLASRLMRAAIAFGYCLGPDDVWRQHSWGVMGNGTILDTHSQVADGISASMDSMEAVKFAEDHLGVAEVLRFLREKSGSSSASSTEARKVLASIL